MTNKTNNKIDNTNMLISIYKENFDSETIAERKLNESLQTYVANCHYYGKQDLISAKHFNKRTTRNKMTNTNYLEFLDKKSSPYNLFNIYQNNSNLRNYKNLQNNQPVETIETNDYSDRVRDLNYLAETKFIETMVNIKNISTHNEKLLNEYEKPEELFQKSNHIPNKQLVQTHMRNYLDSIERKFEDKESLGITKLARDNKVKDRLNERSFEYTGTNNQNNEQNQYQEFNSRKQTANETESNNKDQDNCAIAQGYRIKSNDSVYLNKATNMLNGIQTKYRFQDQERLNVNDVMDDSKFHEGSKLP